MDTSRMQSRLFVYTAVDAKDEFEEVIYKIIFLYLVNKISKKKWRYAIFFSFEVWVDLVDLNYAHNRYVDVQWHRWVTYPVAQVDKINRRKRSNLL